jgi:CBS domain-containing protein
MTGSSEVLVHVVMGGVGAGMDALPVIDGSEVVGVITGSDPLRVLAGTDLGAAVGDPR